MSFPEANDRNPNRASNGVFAVEVRRSFATADLRQAAAKAQAILYVLPSILTMGWRKAARQNRGFDFERSPTYGGVKASTGNLRHGKRVAVRNRSKIRNL